VSDLLERVRETGLLPPGATAVVLLSGGRDSVCLLDVAVRLLGPGAVRAVHCNYGLRPGADADAEHCAALCGTLGVPLEVARPARPGGAHNVQAWAREARYAAAARAAAPGAVVAAGHTASDQVEGVLYRLAASPGRRALLGMAPRAGAVVRPLLGVWREETAAHCRARGLAWREDPTNDGRAYARGRVRNELLPLLRAIHPAADRNVVRTLELLRDEAAVLDEAVAAALAAAGDPPRVDALRALPPALARLALQAAADRALPSPPAPPLAVGHRTAEVLALGEGGALDLGAGLRARVEGGRLAFGRSAGPAAPQDDPPRP
jgi:tRNA(Ile)-lysidine synthase